MTRRLYLVPGTRVESIGRSGSPTPVAGAATAVSAVPDVAAELSAAILQLELAPRLTVRDALCWLGGGYEVYDEDVCIELTSQLIRIGIVAQTYDASATYIGCVLIPDKLLQVHPHLQPYRDLLSTGFELR